MGGRDRYTGRYIGRVSTAVSNDTWSYLLCQHIDRDTVGGISINHLYISVNCGSSLGRLSVDIWVDTSVDIWVDTSVDTRPISFNYLLYIGRY